MAAVRHREADDAGVSRRVRRRGMDPAPARAASASGVLSGDSDADPTQSQAASWHPSQVRPGWLFNGSGIGTDTDDDPRGRSQPEAAAQATAPPVAASQSAAHTRRIMSQATLRQASDRGDLASQRPGHDVPATGLSVEVGVPSDAPRRRTRSLTRHAHRLARADDDAPANNDTSQPAGETVLGAQEDGATQPPLQHARLSSHGSLADSGCPVSQAPAAQQPASDSQRSGRGGSAAPSAAAAQGVSPRCAMATGMQRITRFFAPLTALMGAHSSQQQSQAATAAATAAAGPPQGQEEAEDGTAPNEVTSAERRFASQQAPSQRDRATAEHSPSRVPPTQLAFLDREGLQPSQHSIEVALSAAGLAPPSSGGEFAAAAANGAPLAAPSQHLQVSTQAQRGDERMHAESIFPAAAEPAADEATTEDAAALCHQRALALDQTGGDNAAAEALRATALEMIIAAEGWTRPGDFRPDGAKCNVPGVEDAATWDHDLELNLFEVRALPFDLLTFRCALTSMVTPRTSKFCRAFKPGRQC